MERLSVIVYAQGSDSSVAVDINGRCSMNLHVPNPFDS